MKSLVDQIKEAFEEEISAENMFGAQEILVGKSEFFERLEEIVNLHNMGKSE